jgi:hypothetical protein
MKPKSLNKIKSPVVRIDNSLEKYKGRITSGQKLEEANAMLKNIGLPKTKKQS